MKKGISAVGIDTKEKTVLLSTGEKVFLINSSCSELDRKTFFPPISNIDAGNIFGLHNFDDCLKIMATVKKAENIAIMGGGSYWS